MVVGLDVFLAVVAVLAGFVLAGSVLAGFVLAVVVLAVVLRQALNSMCWPCRAAVSCEKSQGLPR